MHDVQGDNLRRILVERVEHGCIHPAATARPETKSAGDEAARELLLRFDHESPTLPPGAGPPGRGANGRPSGETARVKRHVPRRYNKRLLVCSFMLAAGFTLIGAGVLRGLTGDARSNLPALIEQVDPLPDAQTVPEQTRIFVDLQAGYTGVLVVDGTELETEPLSALQSVPGQQARKPLTTVYEEGNATLTFEPSAGAPIESLTQGVHTVKVIYWRLTEDRSAALAYQWSFTVF